ncbi:MAG: molybdopterin-guanine dinucleotide biosynthesis protein B [Chloroflexi bacterium RBG_13_60_13]|nr:MAG: molybdopterin-guanine dinucleotide biosynthesis protein B [Chloroflexi bacterium RBG_13_60_13]
MPVVLSFVGPSNSGKTTLLTNLIPELKRRGHRVAVAKHSVGDLDLDQPGKDSWRLARAGSDAVAVSGPHRVALVKKVERDPTLEEVLDMVGDGYDVVLIEGFKRSKVPKIEVHRKVQGDLVCSPEELFAVVTDEPLDIPVPQFSADQGEALADLIEDRFLASASGGRKRGTHPV